MVGVRASLPSAVSCLTILATTVWFLADYPVFKLSTIPGHGQRVSQLPSQDLLKGLDTHSKPDESTNDTIQDVQNRTLGFQKIYAISMPHRTDKRDYLALMGLVSSIDITFVDGINGSNMHPDAIPPYWKGSNTVGEYGCWRAHMDVYRHMVQNSISSALVFEDDADWDVLLRPQVASLARGLRYLQGGATPNRSPYGDAWDILAIGHNGLNNRLDKDQKYYVTRNDPTVIAEARRTWSRKPNLSAPELDGEYTRVVMEISRFTSLTAYALSLRGAAQLLHDQALLPNARAIDVGMSDFCSRREYGRPCYGAYPMLFGRFRGIGPKSRDSDRRTSSNEAVKGSGGGQAKADRLLPESEFTVFPFSLNLKKLMKGETVLPANDQEKDMLKSVDLKTFVMPQGEEVFVRQDKQ